jgi:transcriptional regulator with XRE-family HTH domain
VEARLDLARGWRLAELRQRRGPTQAQVAARMGVSIARISQIENGGLSTQDVLARYVSALGGALKLIADFGDEQLKIAQQALPALMACRSPTRGAGDRHERLNRPPLNPHRSPRPAGRRTLTGGNPHGGDRSPIVTASRVRAVIPWDHSDRHRSLSRAISSTS